MKRAYLTVVCILCVVIYSRAQDSKLLMLSPSFTFQKGSDFNGQLNLKLVRLEANHDGYGYYGFSGGAGYVKSGDNSALITKLGYEVSGMILSFKLSQFNYIYNSIDIGIMPEIGLDFITLGTFCYGYNCHILGNKFEPVSRHNFTLTFNISYNLKTHKVLDF